MPTRPRSSSPGGSALDSSALTNRVAPGVRVLFVGINPGVRSARIGHHFAGYSNRFWKLLCDAGLVPNASARKTMSGWWSSASASRISSAADAGISSFDTWSGRDTRQD